MAIPFDSYYVLVVGIVHSHLYDGLNKEAKNTIIIGAEQLLYGYYTAAVYCRTKE